MLWSIEFRIFMRSKRLLGLAGLRVLFDNSPIRCPKFRHMLHDAQHGSWDLCLRDIGAA